MTWPLVELLATEERLTFRARFGLGRFFGPWHLDGGQVKSIALTAKGTLQSGIELSGTQGERWVFFAMSEPREQVIRVLEDLGYSRASTP